LPRIDTIDEDTALLRLVEAEQKAPHSRLAGSDASDDADLLAAFDLEGYLVEGLAGRIGVSEADAVESDRAITDLSRDIGTRRGSLALQRHDAIDGLQRAQRLRSARDHRRDPRDRCQNAPRQHVCRHQRSDRELAVEYEEYADDDQGEAGELLGRIGARQRERGPEMDVFARAGRCCDGSLPGRLHAGFGAGRAYRLEAGQRLDQHAMTRRSFSLLAFHGPVQRALQCHADQEHDRQHHQGYPGQRPGDHKEDPDKQHGKQQIRRGHDAAGREELAH